MKRGKIYSDDLELGKLWFVKRKRLANIGKKNIMPMNNLNKSRI
jgi:hypothetical protein